MKYIFGLAICLIVISVVSSGSKSDEQVDYSKEFRVRVIAENNNEENIELKEEIIEQLKKVYQDVEDPLSYSRKYRGYIENVIAKYTDDFTVNVGENYFPIKAYEGKILENKEYPSLVVKLGVANGKNSWFIVSDQVLQGEEVKISFWVLEKLNELFK